MSAYKQFNSQDILVSPLEVQRGYNAISTDPLKFTNQGYDFIIYGVDDYGDFPKKVGNFANDIGIDRYIGRNNDWLDRERKSGQYREYWLSSVYHSIKHLYYSNYISGSVDAQGNFLSSPADVPLLQTDGLYSGSRYNPIFDNYRQTDLLEQKTWPTGSDDYIGVVSIPTKIFGDNVVPGSFRWTCPPYSGSGGGTLYDDGEGRILSASKIVGNIVYPHGMATVTSNFIDSGYGVYRYGDATGSLYGAGFSEENWFFSFFSGSSVTASFSSSYTIYETQYKITADQDSYNYTLNPTVYSGSNGNLYDFATSSYFSPYVTTVGLYNDAYELLAVGKLAKPLQMSDTTDTTILVNIDRQ